MKFILLICLLLPNLSWAGEMVSMPGSAPVYSDLHWYRRNTPNFEILSLNDHYGAQVAAQIESLKSWTLTRWGLPDIPYRKPCQILCVPDVTTLRKAFRITQPYAESTGTFAACWVVTDQTMMHSLPIFLTEIGLSAYESQHQVRIGYWARRGMSILSGNSAHVKTLLAPIAPHIAANRRIFFSEPLFTLKKESVVRSSEENMTLFDREAAILCLMLRREFGQRRFLILLVDSSPNSLYAATGYRGYSQFDSAFKRYLFYSARDMASNNMPDSYFNITVTGGVR